MKARGRWRADQSVRRYDRHARVLKEVERLPAETRAYGQNAMDHLDDLLVGRWKPPPPPGLSAKQLVAKRPLQSDLPATTSKRLRG